MRRAGLKRFTGTSVVLTAALLASCMANPGPAPTLDEPEDQVDAPADEKSSGDGTANGQGKDAQEGNAPEGEDPASGEVEDGTERSAISVGIDPFQLGFNPHLAADGSELVDSIANLVFPSTFNGNFLDTNMLHSAVEVDAPSGTAQRLRYSIKEGAQWSDGTPITGADFDYLWKEMVSTPGVRDVAPYRAISKITTSSGGSIVTVDLSTRVDDWHQLFTHLLPSHLLESGQFDRVLESDIPASAGKFSVASIDQARGLITLNRNDRFWGNDPAKIDVVQLRAIRSTSQAANLLRSDQVRFVDISPTQTLEEQLSLVGDISTETVHPTRQLRLNLSTQSEALFTPQLRRTMMSLIDSDQLARLATERSVDLRVPYGGNPLLGTATEEDIAALRAVSEQSPLRIGVDPTDPAAAIAAMTMVDMLRNQGIESSVVENRMTTIVGESLPDGEVDAVISGVDTSLTPANMASFFTCQTDEASPAESTDSAAASASATAESNTAEANSEEPGTDESSTEATEAPEETSDKTQKAWSGNLSLACGEGYEAWADSILSGELSAQEGLELIRHINSEQALYLPLIDETRIRAFDASRGGGALADLDEMESGL